MEKRYLVLRGDLKDGVEQDIPVPVTKTIRFQPTGETEQLADGKIAEVFRPIEESA